MRNLTLLPALAGLMAALAGVPAPAAETPKPVERHYASADNGVQLTLRQRRPDAVRAFFIARGFSGRQADTIARQCIFLVGIRNTATAGALDIDLSGWRVDAGQGPQPLRLKEDWLKHWQQAGAPATARTAFYWSMYHSRQHLEPGERMFGMVSMGLPADTRFTLDFSWQRDGVLGQGRLSDLQCAPDPSISPTEE